MRTQTEQLTEQFNAALGAMLVSLSQKATAQFQYNLETNLPRGIVKREDAVENALEHGVSAAVSTHTHWDCEAAVRYAGAILEDSNCHTENSAMQEAARKMGAPA